MLMEDYLFFFTGQDVLSKSVALLVVVPFPFIQAPLMLMELAFAPSSLFSLVKQLHGCWLLAIRLTCHRHTHGPIP